MSRFAWLATACVLASCAEPVNRHVIPRDPFPERTGDAPNAITDSLQVSTVVPYRANGGTGYVIERSSLEGSALIVATADGSIPAFASADSARAFVARLAQAADDSQEERVLSQLAGQFLGAPMVDLDAAYTWAAHPGDGPMDAKLIANAWGLVAPSGEAPPLPPADVARLASLVHDDALGQLAEEGQLELSTMKLHVAADGGTTNLPTAADEKRIAATLEPAIRRFVARITTMTPDIEQELRARH